MTPETVGAVVYLPFLKVNKIKIFHKENRKYFLRSYFTMLMVSWTIVDVVLALKRQYEYKIYDIPAFRWKQLYCSQSLNFTVYYNAQPGEKKTSCRVLLTIPLCNSLCKGNLCSTVTLFLSSFMPSVWTEYFYHFVLLTVSTCTRSMKTCAWNAPRFYGLVDSKDSLASKNS